MTTRVEQQKFEGAGLNLTRRQHNTGSREKGSGVVVKGTGISFTGSATIADSGNGLAQFAVGSTIIVKGSPLNSRRWRVTASAAGSLTVTPAQVQSESAGATIEIEREG